jgi:chromosomal replication initiator protein
MTGSTASPAEIWAAAHGELELQMTRETFDTWLRDARLITHEDGTYIIGVRNIYAREWLEKRLKKVVTRTLGEVAGRSVEVRFVVWSDYDQDDDLSDAGPLLAGVPPLPRPAARQPAPPDDDKRADDHHANNHRYTFDNFIGGPCNRVAKAAALAVAEAPGRRFNPLYLTGEVGVGKSHLLHAIGNAIAAKGLEVLQLSCEAFTNELVSAIRTKTTEHFRDKYRHADALLLDDVHFLAGKGSTQEELYHTFNALYEANKQIVLAADRPPSAIKGLDSRLRSRFEGGLVVDIQSPDVETRVGILQVKAKQHSPDAVPAEILDMVARKSNGGVRELEGALVRALAPNALIGQQLTLPLVEAALQDTSQATPEQQAEASLGEIIEAVAECYHITAAEIRGRSRSGPVSLARQVAMYLARQKTNLSLTQIGQEFGGRGRSTVLYSCKRVAEMLKSAPPVSRQVEAITARLSEHKGYKAQSKQHKEPTKQEVTLLPQVERIPS